MCPSSNKHTIYMDFGRLFSISRGKTNRINLFVAEIKFTAQLNNTQNKNQTKQKQIHAKKKETIKSELNKENLYSLTFPLISIHYI